MSQITTGTEKDGGKGRGRGIEIIINGQLFEAPKPHMTGRELLELAGAPEINQLFLEVPGSGEDQLIGADSEIRIRKGMSFYDVPVGTFG